MPLSQPDYICKQVNGVTRLNLSEQLSWITNSGKTPYNWDLEEKGAYFVKYSELKKRNLLKGIQ